MGRIAFRRSFAWCPRGFSGLLGIGFTEVPRRSPGGARGFVPCPRLVAQTPRPLSAAAAARCRQANAQVRLIYKFLLG